MKNQKRYTYYIWDDIYKHYLNNPKTDKTCKFFSEKKADAFLIKYADERDLPYSRFNIDRRERN